MKSSMSLVAGGFLIACLNSAQAADYQRYHPSESPVGARTKPYRYGRLVPGCYENFPPILLQCPDVVVADDPDVDYSVPLRVIPRQRRKPYPSLFSWSYGGR